MVLIADSGSTKCDWVLLNVGGTVLLKTQTEGLNPAVLPQEQLSNRILENKDLKAIISKVKIVDFYGAGASTKTPQTILKSTLQHIFIEAKVAVYEDMLGAVLAVTTKPGIVCILGTGSNSCYFDGAKIHSPIPSLGYILMDEASGNYFGKKLLTDYFYGNMPLEIANVFENEFDLDPDTIKLNLYQRPNPNAYLASFTPFLFASEGKNEYFTAMIAEGINDFIKKNILNFEQAHQVPIHFIGTIAHFSENAIKVAFLQHNLQLGTIVRRPIDGLINYYQTYRLKEKLT